MSPEYRVEPPAVLELVESFLEKEYSSAERENRLPFDDRSVHSLHLLAAQIYALGHSDGAEVTDERYRRQHQRRRALMVEARPGVAE